MAKDKLTEYDATAANNTVVGDVNLAENSALPSDMNNAVREVMSHLKGFASGTDAIDALTVTGAATVNGAFTSPGIDDNANATAITIDSSENVLVGTTNTDPAFNNVAGQSMAASGQFQVTRDGGIPALINRKSDDGTILDVRKDGSTVGSIGASGGRPYFSNGTESIRLAGGSFEPANATGGASDNTYDLGVSGARWKNLYLSGGAYLGGTGSANLLSDYEIGAWTGTLKGQTSDPSTAVTATGYYTKIGRLVHISINFDNVNTTGAAGRVEVHGVPFTEGTGAQGAASGSAAAYNFNLHSANGLSVQVSTAILFIYTSRDSTTWTNANHIAGTNRYLALNATYHVN